MPDDIAAGVKRLERLVRVHRALVSCISTLSELAMADGKDLSTEIDSFKDKLAAREATIAAHEAAHKQLEDRLNATIAELQAKIDAGFDTQPFIDQLEGIKALIPTDAPSDIPTPDPQIPADETPVPTNG